MHVLTALPGKALKFIFAASADMSLAGPIEAYVV